MNTINNEEKRPKRHLAPVFVLLILGPAIAELLLGDIPLDASLPFLLLLNLSYYGTGAVIIREIVRRRGLHWFWIPILAFAYGLIEEGLVLHSLFNPNFPGIGSLGFYGRAFGVDWIWAMFVLGLHTIWSISLPILLTELLFHNYRRERWIGNIGLGVNCIIFVLGLTFLAYIYATRVTPGFTPSPIALIATALLVTAILLLALFTPAKPATTISSQAVIRNTLNPWLVGLFAFLIGGLFLGVHLVFPNIHDFFPQLEAIPAPFAFLVFLILTIVSIIAIRQWSVPDRRWTDTHWVALAFGVLLDYCLFGFLVTRPDPVNQVFHGIVAIITIVLTVLLTLKVRTRVAAPPQPQSAPDTTEPDHSLPLAHEQNHAY